MNVQLRHLYSRWPRKATLVSHIIKRGKANNSSSSPNRVKASLPVAGSSKFSSSAASAVRKIRQSSVYPGLHHSYEIDGEIQGTSPSPGPLPIWSKEDVVRRIDGQPFWDPRGIPLELTNTGDNIAGGINFMPNLWLRENCLCKECVNGDTMQRAVDTFSIPEDIKPSKVVTAKLGLRITWDDGHESLFPWSWISTHRSEQFKAKPTDTRIFWGAEIGSEPPSVHYDEIMAGDAGVGAWTEKIRVYGFCYVDGCPVSPEKTEELLKRISFIRETHYGGFYDFTSDLTMKDTAYTSLALPAHTDTTYFSDPAGLQMFHLLSHADGTGGTSLLVDGFKAAKTLLAEDRQAYKTLTGFYITAHASGNEGIIITPGLSFSVIESPGRSLDNVKKIRWNNDDRATLPLNTTTEKWYKAARKFNEILKRKDMEYWAQLEPGRPLIFDNWRVLHGRSSFTGKRRICGGYINHDDYVSRWRNTNFTRKEALRQIL